MSADLHSPDDLAKRFEVGREYVMDQVRAQRWPHLRFGRKVRFSDEQVAQILATQTVTPTQPTKANPFAHVTRGGRP